MIALLQYLLIALGMNVLLFVPAFIWKTDKLTDLSYALTFIVLILAAFLLSAGLPLQAIVAGMVIVWGLRLGGFLFIRIRKMKKDQRFDGMRESFTRFLKFWVLQGLAVWIILIPAFSFMGADAGKVSWIGAALWLSGLVIESVADLQKYRFNQDPSNKGRFISTGLWKYSRHPNYFGEMACWVGMYLFVFLSLSTWERIVGLASPLFIIILLLFVTGLPPLEKYADEKWGKEKAYRQYKSRTSILVPWPPR